MLLRVCFLQEMVDWFNAIRAARFHYLQVAFPGASDEEVRIADLITQQTDVELAVEKRQNCQRCRCIPKPRNIRNFYSLCVVLLLISSLISMPVQALF